MISKHRLVITIAVFTVLGMASCVRAQGRSALGADVGRFISATMDGYYAWYEQGFNPGAPTSGLPHPGITNAVTGSAGTGGPAGTFLMQPYNANNALLINPIHRLGTLSFATPTPANAFWLVADTGFGPDYINTVTHFADGTPDFTQNYLTQNDWYNITKNVFNTGGRVDVNPYNFASLDSIPGNFEAVGVLRVGITTIVFPDPALHPISSIDINWYSGYTDPQFASNTAIFGVSVSTNGAAGPFNAVQLTPSSFNQDVVVEAAALAQPVPEPGLMPLVAPALLFLRRRRAARSSPKPQSEILESRTLLSTTWTVTSTADDGSAGTLRNIIGGASAGDTVVFDAAVFSAAGAPHAITLNGTPIEITKDITIQGPGAAVLTLDGNNVTRGFIIDPGADLTFSGASIANCNNTVDTSGGAIFVQSDASLSIDQSVLSNNHGNLGGAIFNQGTCVLTASSFGGNSATNTAEQFLFAKGGGAIENVGTLNASGCTFTGNTAVAGGAIDVYSNLRSFPPATLTNCTFQSNTATGRYAGGGAISSGGNLTATGCTFTGNSDTHSFAGIGGAVSVYGPSNFTTCLFSGNTAKTGSAMYVMGSPGAATVTDSTFDSNSASSGTIAVLGTLNLTRSTASDNTASNGAGLWLNTGGTITTIDSTIANNTATAGGGGIYNLGGTLSCTNTTISGNVGSTGGGIFTSVAVTLNNTIVSGNATLPSQPFNYNAVAEIDGTANGSFNLIGPSGTGGMLNSVNFNIVGAPAALSPLADFGGPTKTMALLPGSLAFNTGYTPLAVDQNGLALSTDQRGLPRQVSSSVDIGAYEAQSPAAIPSDLVATAAPDQISLSWSNNGSNGPFALYRGTSPGGEDAVPIASQITNSFVDANVLRGVTYYYRVAAADAFGHGAFSNEVSASPVPIAPLSSSDGQASLTFVRDADNFHIDWTFGANSGQFPAGDPNFITVLGNPAMTTLNLDPIKGNAMPSNLRLEGTFMMNTQSNFPFFGVNIDIDQSTVYFAIPQNILPGPASMIREYLSYGFAGGAWNGIMPSEASITSSAVTADKIGKYSVGYADSADHVVPGQPANTVEVRFTVTGDANLDGVCNYSDALILQANYNATNLPAWDRANFDYNNSVSSNDAILLARNYLASVPPPAQPATTVAAPVTTTTPTPTPTPTPSPTTPTTNSTTSGPTATLPSPNPPPASPSDGLGDDSKRHDPRHKKRLSHGR